MQFGVPSVPQSLSLTEDGFATNRFNKVNDTYDLDFSFDLNTTIFDSGSFITNSVEIATFTGGSPQSITVNSTAYPSLASGSHVVTASLSVILADSSRFTTQDEITLTLNKTSPGNPSLTADYSEVQGGGSTNSSDLRINVGATGSITYTSQSNSANSWESVHISNDDPSPPGISLAGGVNIPAVALSNYWQSPSGDNDPQINTTTNRTYTVDRVFTFKWGAASAASLTQANILDLQFLEDEGFQTSSVNDENPLNENLTIQGNSLDYHYIIVKSNIISDTPTITVNNSPITMPLVATYSNIVGSEGFKVFRTGQQGTSAVTYKITSL